MARRSGLGKGLSALIPAESINYGNSVLKEVPIGNVRPNQLQPRSIFDEEKMSSLASSIQEVGLLQPILVRQTGSEEYEIIAGERRWRAARRAGLQTITVILHEADENVSLEKALVENLHREDLNVLEEAAAFQQLIDGFGYTHDQVAKRVGKSRSVVSNTLRLLQLPASVQRALAENRITAGHARALLSTPDRELQEKLVQRIVAEELTVRMVEDIIRAYVQNQNDDSIDKEIVGSGELGGKQTDGDVPAASVDADTVLAGSDHGNHDRDSLPYETKDAGVLELEHLLGEYLNTRVKVNVAGKRGKLIIEFSSIEDLERIYKSMIVQS
jgi:ParB family chromosome partitioning protein